MSLLPDPASFAVFLTASVVISITPGPDLTYVFARGLAHGRLAGVISVAGIVSGLIVHTCLVAFGLAALVAGSDLAFDLIRYLGAAYLIWMGVRLIRSRAGLRSDGRAVSASRWSAWYLQGLVTNLLNPKILLFFLAFLPQFADPAHGSMALQIMLLGAILIGCGLVALLTVALASGAMGSLLARHPLWLKVQNAITGSLMIGLALFLLASERR
jgi:threonine/homoserine/homoserine lactone efflux protein